jgi:phospholipid-binding lipoprotein MlaA
VNSSLDWARPGAALLLAALLGALLGGCASTAVGPRNRADPLEPMNRYIFAFNEGIDKAAVKPLAEVYAAIVPEWLRSGIDNMYNNLADGWSAVNLLAQARLQRSVEMGMRVAVNSTFGLFGFNEVAAEMGLDRDGYEDFGQTLGRWGVGNGPYLVLPFLGPSTLRDTFALPLDWKYAPSNIAFSDVAARNISIGVRLLNDRVRLLTATRLLDVIALDKYTLLRDAYLARRRSQIYDGEPPEDEPAPAAEPAAAREPAPANEPATK